MGISQWIKRRFFRSRPATESEVVKDLRLTFMARYHNFKLLLNSNTRALEKMAEMEKALKQTEPFGMPMIKAAATAVCVEVFRMIQNLDELMPGKYETLYQRFYEIESAISKLLAPAPPPDDPRLMVFIDEIRDDLHHLTGHKMARLGEIHNKTELRVPGFFVVTSTAHDLFLRENDLQTEIDRRLQSADFADFSSLGRICEEIRVLITTSPVPDKLSHEMYHAYDQLTESAGGPVKLAIRSSAKGEDSDGSSFAGQYDSKLNVERKGLLQAYKEVIASQYSLQATIYRFNCGIKNEGNVMSVGCMQMIDSVAGGITYSRDPFQPDEEETIINASWGLPSSVMDGSVTGDRFAVSCRKPYRSLRQTIHEKPIQAICSPEDGILKEPVSESMKNASCLTEDQLCSLAHMAVVLEEYFQLPQDIEWAIDRNETLYCLQCRPLVQVEASTLSGSSEWMPEQETILLEGGITTSQGAAAGPVFMVRTSDDAMQVPDGSVVVVKHALPSWAPMLKHAAAVITEHGSFAGHLANITREFGIPALFNLEDAMESLQSGKTVTVDAERRQIHQGSINELLKSGRPKSNLMANSPVYRTLEDISRWVVPLNLIDPDSREFTPENCRTLHDMTRFIHEKSVYEMFNFGTRSAFSEGVAKQLVYKVPMQWWVLNLNDGFREEVPGKRVKLSEIASIPMLALWEGMLAIPWEGPPPVDSRGMLSVMFQATTNTALITGRRSQYSEKNYFMITRNFCSFTSRLGFHYSTIEAMVSCQEEENYISFQFKGGAADSQRRNRRVKFLRELLETIEFSTRVKEDVLIARTETRPPEEIIRQLIFLGHLNIHTRQLDMIMGNESKVVFYREKLLSEINQLQEQYTPVVERLVAELKECST